MDDSLTLTPTKKKGKRYQTHLGFLPPENGAQKREADLKIRQERGVTLGVSCIAQTSRRNKKEKKHKLEISLHEKGKVRMIMKTTGGKCLRRGGLQKGT